MPLHSPIFPMLLRKEREKKKKEGDDERAVTGPSDDVSNRVLPPLSNKARWSETTAQGENIYFLPRRCLGIQPFIPASALSDRDFVMHQKI